MPRDFQTDVLPQESRVPQEIDAPITVTPHIAQLLLACTPRIVHRASYMPDLISRF